MIETLSGVRDRTKYPMIAQAAAAVDRHSSVRWERLEETYAWTRDASTTSVGVLDRLLAKVYQDGRGDIAMPSAAEKGALPFTGDD